MGRVFGETAPLRLCPCRTNTRFCVNGPTDRRVTDGRVVCEAVADPRRLLRAREPRICFSPVIVAAAPPPPLISEKFSSSIQSREDKREQKLTIESEPRAKQLLSKDRFSEIKNTVAVLFQVFASFLSISKSRECTHVDSVGKVFPKSCCEGGTSKVALGTARTVCTVCWFLSFSDRCRTEAAERVVPHLEYKHGDIGKLQPPLPCLHRTCQ